MEYTEQFWVKFLLGISFKKFFTTEFDEVIKLKKLD